MKLWSLTDIGIKRSENQDNYWASILDVDGEEVGVVCLCDGMGGLKNGGLASKIVVNHVKDYITSDFEFAGLYEVLEQANEEIVEIGSKEEKPMGTTCTILICKDGEYRIMHIGDSRCYHISNGKAEILTIDHSAVKHYNVTKENNPKLWNKYKNMLTRCIGVKPTIKLDAYEGTYKEGDLFFVCSDGCWHYLDDFPFDIENIFDLKTLIKKCIDSGETDNISIGVLQI